MKPHPIPFLLLPVLAALLLGPLLAAPAELVGVEGTVELTRVDGEAPKACKVGDRLYVGDRLRTLAGAGAQVRFANGSLTAVGEKTIFTVRSLEEGTSMKVGLNLASGSLYSAIKKLGANEQFTVHTPSAVAGVRGTELGVQHEGRRSLITVHQGRVAVTAMGQPASMLDAGQAAEIEEGGAAIVRALQEDERARGAGFFGRLTNAQRPANGSNLQAPPGGTNGSTNMARPGGRRALLNILQPIRPPYLAGVAEKGARITVKVNDRQAGEERSLASAAFRFNLDGALREDPLGEKPNRVDVRAENADGATAQASFTVFWDRTPPSLSGLVWRLVPGRLLIEGGIGEAGMLMVAGVPVPLDPHGRVIPGFGIPLERVVEGVNAVFASDRAGNRVNANWVVKKPRQPPPPPAR